MKWWPLISGQENESAFRKDIIGLVGDDTHIYTNIIPSAPYRDRHYHVFMNAMQPGSEWLYHGETLPENSEEFFSIGPCLRTDGGLQWVGKSPKRLLLFQMLWYEGMASLNDLDAHIHRVHEKIKAVLWHRKSIWCRIHPETRDTVGTILRDLGIDFEHSVDCLFSEPKKTDRSGYRIEFVTEHGSQIELFNLVILTQLKNTALSRYIIDGGWSLERMLMVREGVDSGDKTSIFPVAESIYQLWTPESPIETKRRIVNLLRWIAYLKINHIATSQHAQHTSIQKTLSTLYRMLYIAVYDLLDAVDAQQIIHWLDTEIAYITGESRNLDDLKEKIQDIEIQKEKIAQALQQFGPSAMQKIANRYCGGCTILPTVVFKKQGE